MPRPRRSAPRRPVAPAAVDPEVGREVDLEVGPVAHGGHCVARLDGRVVFVRHTLPGERVRARVTETGKRFWRADAVEVLEASEDRVPSAWPEAGPGGVGGGELAHVSLPAQRRWKAAVLAEQLARLARLDRPVEVEAAPGDEERAGLGYRTRIELAAGADGRAGMRRFRSHDVVPLTGMPLATDRVAALAEAEGVWTRRWEPGARLELVAPAGESAEPLLLVDGTPWRRGRADTRPNARRAVAETLRLRAVDGDGGGDLHYRVAADGFWQVHREAPGLLAGAVLDAVGDVAGGRVLDLYSGAGLFTLPLARAVGDAGTVVAVESDARAVKDARRNAHDLPQVDLRLGAVDRVLASGDVAGAPVGDADVVVLDPPRAGAGRGVVDAIAERSPRRVVYVACDPAALARDVAYLAERGYELADLRAFDLFPHTHHVEAVAVLRRA
ncbi:class I SAM-dependent RNA methyltransferase [Isoptericola sp. BMS4]|uniref:class I SAM-dependent RNA methyltransferase n=1 Tax=Isoptericola sp. BMS4 TaxID=2527875 RepID=UPI0014228543|nr:TRAM domain-containing protein [Isoptericola sp. BMS4]